MTNQISDDAAYGMKLNDEAILVVVLAQSLSQLSDETIGRGAFKDADNLAQSYRCLANCALALAEKLREAAP